MESTHVDLELFKTDRIGLIARELREPVANVLERLEQVLGGSDPLTAKQRLLLTGARDPAPHLRETIEDVQEAARLQEGKPRLELSPQDMRTLVRDAVERNAFPAAAKSISLVAELPAAALPVTADRAMILQLFNNLISNAIKFSSAGGNVHVGARRTATGVQGWVRDEGQGMHPYDLQHLFQKFPRMSARPPGAERSTGLGLYIVSEILRLHHGTIRVMTEAGKGSTFVFELPRRPSGKTVR